MAASPNLKVFDANGKYMAACHEMEAAASLAAFYGPGSTVRYGHSKRVVLWTEGQDGQAGESYDAAAQVMYQRIEQRLNKPAEFDETRWYPNA